MNKSQIRDQIKETRRRLVREEAGRLGLDSALICRKIESMPEFRSARIVLSYTPLKGEVDVTLLDCSGKTVILADCDWTAIPAGEIDFAIIPGVAFARMQSGGFMRLGRGGGYYDRLIPLLHCPKVAPSFSFQMFDALPCDEWDCPVDAVVLP